MTVYFVCLVVEQEYYPHGLQDQLINYLWLSNCCNKWIQAMYSYIVTSGNTFCVLYRRPCTVIPLSLASSKSWMWCQSMVMIRDKSISVIAADSKKPFALMSLTFVKYKYHYFLLPKRKQHKLLKTFLKWFGLSLCWCDTLLFASVIVLKRIKYSSRATANSLCQHEHSIHCYNAPVFPPLDSFTRLIVYLSDIILWRF